jgi:hypothetical protein
MGYEHLAGVPFYINEYASISDKTYQVPDGAAVLTAMVTKIVIGIRTNGGTNPFKVGACTQTGGSTIEPGNYVELNVSGLGTGEVEFTSAAGDFTPFEMSLGDFVHFYNSSSSAIVAFTDNHSVDYARYTSGDQMSAASYTLTDDITSTPQVEFFYSSGWDVATINGVDPADLDQVVPVSLSDIEKINNQ